MRIMEQSDADFICLQEVITDFKTILMDEPWVRQKYHLNQSNWYTSYGVLILSKWPCKFFERPYSQSRMGRSLLVCETVINNQPIVVATSHFESLDNPKVRAS